RLPLFGARASPRPAWRAASVERLPPLARAPGRGAVWCRDFGGRGRGPGRGREDGGGPGASEWRDGLTERVWGIYRELAHSPGRGADDARILARTAEELTALGLAVTLKTPEEVLEGPDAPPPFVFGMCERTGILARLAAWEEDGVVVVNSPAGVLNTYRDRTA